MYSEDTSTIQKFDATFTYGEQPLPYSIWSNSKDRNVSTIIFLGLIQIDKLGEWVINTSPDHTIVVQGAPYWFAKADGSDIPTFMFDFTASVLKQLSKDFSLNNLHILAESQAVPGVLEVLSRNSEYLTQVQKVTLIQPLGLNSQAYAGSDTRRLRNFRRRIVANASFQLLALLSDERLRYNHRLLNKMVSADGATARAQYNSGLAYDAMPSLVWLYRMNRNIAIICGANDKLFPAKEIKASLDKHRVGIEITIVKNTPHSPLATAYGQRLLRRALS